MVEAILTEGDHVTTITVIDWGGGRRRSGSSAAPTDLRVLAEASAPSGCVATASP